MMYKSQIQKKLTLMTGFVVQGRSHTHYLIPWFSVSGHKTLSGPWQVLKFGK